MTRSKPSISAPQQPVEHKTKHTGNTVKTGKQKSFNAIDKQSRVTTRLIQKAARAERHHAHKIQEYADEHAIKMKQYADNILNMHLCHDALCQHHGETYED